MRRIGAAQVEVDRDIVDLLRDCDEDLGRSVRVVPEKEQERIVGIRLGGVRPEMVLGVLGLENGDRLQRINAVETTSPEGLLAALEQLGSTDDVTLELRRRGKETRLAIKIR